MKKPQKTGKTATGRKSRKKNSPKTGANFSPALFKAVMTPSLNNSTPSISDFDRLMRYVIYKESPDHLLYKENPLTETEVRMIETTVPENTEWSRILDDLQKEYRRLLVTLEHSSFSRIGESAPQHQLQKRRLHLFTSFLPAQYRLPRLAGAIAFILFAGFGLLAGVSIVMTPRYYEGTNVTPATFTTRGTHDNLGPGIEALYQRDYPAALICFQQIINEEPRSDEALIASYLAGSIHLISARRSMFGLFPSFNQVQVDSGIVCLTGVLNVIRNTEKHEYIEEQCRFILGQAWLMKKNIPDARQEFESVIRLHGIKSQECLKILLLLPSE